MDIRLKSLPAGRRWSNTGQRRRYKNPRHGIGRTRVKPSTDLPENPLGAIPAGFFFPPALSHASNLTYMQAVQADWDLIQTLYAQGVGPKEISARTGVKADSISSRASRRNWQRLVTATKQVMQEPIREKPEIDEHSKRTRAALGKFVSRSAELVEQEIPRLTGKRAIRLNQDLEPLVRNAKQVFGWSENSNEPAVRINLPASTAVVQVQDKHSFPAPALPEPPGQPPLDQA